MNKIYKTKWWGTKFRRKFVWLSHESWDISDHTVNLIGYNLCRFDKTIWAVTNVGSHTSCIPKQLAFSLSYSTWKPCAEHILNYIGWELLELLIILCFRWFLSLQCLIAPGIPNTSRTVSRKTETALLSSHSQLPNSDQYYLVPALISNVHSSLITTRSAWIYMHMTWDRRLSSHRTFI